MLHDAFELELIRFGKLHGGASAAGELQRAVDETELSIGRELAQHKRVLRLRTSESQLGEALNESLLGQRPFPANLGRGIDQHDPFAGESESLGRFGIGLCVRLIGSEEQWRGE